MPHHVYCFDNGFADPVTINFIGEEVANLASPEYIADNKGCFGLLKLSDQIS